MIVIWTLIGFILLLFAYGLGKLMWKTTRSLLVVGVVLVIWAVLAAYIGTGKATLVGLAIILYGLDAPISKKAAAIDDKLLRKS